jgi:hypothetical protein
MIPWRALLFSFAFIGCGAPSQPDDEPVDGEPLGTTQAPLVGGTSTSCTGSGAGITTCGTGAEGCCSAIPLANGVRLDKFQVTAGRMRSFMSATGGDVRGWYAQTKASLRADAVAQIDPYVGYLPTNASGYPWGVEDQLGGFIYLPAEPSASQGCYVGNAKSPGYGAHTYPLAAGADGETRGLTAAQLAAKALNCVTYPLAAAFCAWDGGRLQVKDEHDAAWGSGTYPWGTGPSPGGYATVKGQWTLIDSATGKACPTCDTTHANWSYSYAHPATQRNGAFWDYALYVGEPGRLPKGDGSLGHADLAGNLMELTATFDGTSTTTTDYRGQSITLPNVRWTKNGSWEGHPIGYDAWTFPILTKYGKTGLRCAR